MVVFESLMMWSMVRLFQSVEQKDLFTIDCEILTQWKCLFKGPYQTTIFSIILDKNEWKGQIKNYVLILISNLNHLASTWEINKKQWIEFLLPA